MSDQLYAIDTTSATLLPVPAAHPNLLTYSLQRLDISDDVFQNFFGVEVAIIGMSAHLFSLSAGQSVTFDAKVNGTSIISEGSPSPLTVTGADGPSYSAVWAPSDLSNPPLLAVGDRFVASVSSHNAGNYPALDVCMVPSSQLSLLGA